MMTVKKEIIQHLRNLKLHVKDVIERDGFVLPNKTQDAICLAEEIYPLLEAEIQQLLNSRLSKVMQLNPSHLARLLGALADTLNDDDKKAFVSFAAPSIDFLLTR